jgi:hypothetical protein
VALTFADNLSAASYEDLESYPQVLLRKATRRTEAQDEIKKLMG